MPGLDDVTNLFGNSDRRATLTRLEATGIELAFVCCAVRNQGCAGRRLPWQSKHLPGTQSAEYADAHHAQIVQVLNSADESKNLLFRHPGFLNPLCRSFAVGQLLIQDAARRNDASALPLHPDAVCEFPTNTYRGATSFRQGLDQFARIMKSIDVIRLVVDAEHCVAILNIDTVFGPIPFAEHIQVTDGEIVSIRGYCDPRRMLSGAKTSA